MMTLAEWDQYRSSIEGKPPTNQRLGQWAFNVLWQRHPEIADAIRATECDPFYHDARMNEFLFKLFFEYVDTSSENGSET